MYTKIFLLLLSSTVLMNCSGAGSKNSEDKPLIGINITIDPGHGDTKAYDNFRIGPTGEREEWINLRVATILAKKLSKAGANVLLTRTQDKDLSLGGRAVLAKEHKTDLLVSIHHNGSGSDPDMDLPIVYFYGSASQNPASVDFAKILISGMREKMTFEQAEMGAVYSDHLIYGSGTSILRNTIAQMPGVIGEGGFFTNPDGESRLKSRTYNKLEAQVYFEAILKYVDQGLPAARPVISDTLSFINLSQEFQFELNDGVGSHSFITESLMVLQDGDSLVSTWDTGAGLLRAQPLPSDDDEVSFQVFGRNSRGNALHPSPFTFKTERGHKFSSYETWQTAFDKAELLFISLGSTDSTLLPDDLFLLDEALQFYRLSLDIQIVHPKARLAEEKILFLMKLKQTISNEDMDEELRSQARRLKEYYP